MSLRPVHGLATALSCAAALLAQPAAADPAALRGYNAAIAESSISGISSGAFMAVQFGTAWSSVIKGVGVIAGGPYWCAKADADDFITWYMGPILRATGSCMKGPATNLNASDFIAKADAKAASGDIDPLQNLRRQKIYLFHGYNDKLVDKAATDAAADFYRHYLGDTNRGNLYYQSAIGAGHSLVVKQAPSVGGLNGCSDSDSPYIDQCDYDQAGIILQHIYGALSPPNRGQLTGAIKQFDQSAYTTPDSPSYLSMADTGHVFVPKDCEDGASCRVHIALHGCMQDVGDIGRRFIDDTGYNAWADTNHLIVLYPQAQSSGSNPQACWDWWSYVNHEDSYVTKSGPQIKAIKAMLDAVTAASTQTPPVPGSATPTVIDTSDTSADLGWAPIEGAMSYRVSRASENGSFMPVGDVAGKALATRA
jgi:poly(3-hydroxybutyrate) depolymerase